MTAHSAFQWWRDLWHDHDWEYTADGKSHFSPSRQNVRTCRECGRVERETERYEGQGNYRFWWSGKALCAVQEQEADDE